MITEGISMKWNIKYGRVCRSKRVMECAKEKESVSDYVWGREGGSECER